MITRDDIKEILKKYSEEITYNTSSSIFSERSLGNAIRERDYDKIADELCLKVLDDLMKNARLEAELEIYRTVMGNSNFKMVAEKIKESKNV